MGDATHSKSGWLGGRRMVCPSHQWVGGTLPPAHPDVIRGGTVKAPGKHHGREEEKTQSLVPFSKRLALPTVQGCQPCVPRPACRRQHARAGTLHRAH